jgi:N-dimethylarginine dimethylaminohydrolase
MSISLDLNTHVVMSGVDYFDDSFAINPYMDDRVPIDLGRAKQEHDAIKQALESAGISVTQVTAPADCQDGVYTANWALCRGDKAVVSRLPNKRQAEEPYAEQVLRQLGKEIITPPTGLKFSGQGDALPCGNLLFAGSVYRTDMAMHQFLAEALGYEVISLETVPETDKNGQPTINSVTGWPDSFFYDIDLALAVISPELIAWCPEAFTPESQAKVRGITAVDKIEVSLREATEGFACNLVSTGQAVVMSASAPQLKAALQQRGLQVSTPSISELAKGGGYIRCTTLTLV